METPSPLAPDVPPPHPPPQPPRAPQGRQVLPAGEHRHENSDAPPRTIAGVALALGLVVSAALGAAYLFETIQLRRISATLPHVAVPDDARPDPPREPRLQTDEAADLAALRAREQTTLANYGWIDEKGGIARIPIARAMELVAQRGLPEFDASNKTSEQKAGEVRAGGKDQPQVPDKQNTK